MFLRSWAARLALTVASVVAMALVVPRSLVGREGDALFDGSRDAQAGLARAVAAAALRQEATGAFHTGSSRIDAEWELVTSQMTALGLAQVIHEHPELAPELRPAMRAAVARLVDDDTYGFAREAWGSGPFDSLDTEQGHAYLGYAALGLGALREVEPSTPYAALHDRIIEAFVRRLEAAPDGVLETYPDIPAFPADIASVVGAIGQHARLTGADHSAVIARMAGIYRTRFTDPASGYLHQTITPDGHGAARGSGTAVAAYFWSFADAAYARELGDAIARTGHASFLGFGAVREYAPGEEGGGDVDSGPVVLGVSVSATGFALASARQRGDRELFASLYRTTAFFGVPVTRGERWRFATGGPLGNALLLAMLTARRP